MTTNDRVVLQLIQSRRALDQGAIARTLGARQNTISGVLKRLEAAGRIERDGVRKLPGRGRPMELFHAINPGPILVIKWTSESWHAAVVEDGRLRGPSHTMDPLPVENLEGALRNLRKIRDAVLLDSRLTADELLGATLLINAVLTESGQRLSSTTVPWIRNANSEAFSRVLGCPVQFGLTQIPAMIELRARASDGITSLVMLHVGDGVSAHGAMVDAQWGSERELRGEIGHVVVDPTGPLCGCGHRGCMETLISGPGMLRRVKSDLASGSATALGPVDELSPSALFETLDELSIDRRDPYATALVDEFLDRVAWCVSVVVNLMDPDVIVLFGYAFNGRNHWRQRVLHKSPERILYGAFRPIHIEAPKIPEETLLLEQAKAFAAPLHATSDVV